MKYKVVAVIALFVLVVVLIHDDKRDDSDPPNGRSGFDIFSDARTGCQYLGWRPTWSAGYLTPRLDRDGKQICETAK